MRDAVETPWELKRNKAIKRFVAAWNELQPGDDPESVNSALDALTVAHAAKSLEWESGPPPDWAEKEGRAIERLAAAWKKYEQTGKDDPLVEEELNIALDAIVVIHSAATFVWATGPLKW
jgi:hypothetical protein